jgi:hypothetical protein
VSTSRLPDHEQRILDELERELRRDRRLNRRLRTLGRRRRLDPARILHYDPRPLTVAFLLTVSVALMAAGVATSEPGVIWAFAGVWPLALFSVFRLLCRWTERR